MAYFLANAGCQFFQQQVVIPRMAPGPFARRDRSVIPGGSVEAVGAIDLYFSFFKEPAGCFDESLVLTLIIRSFGCGKENNRITCMPEHKHFEILPDGWGM